MKTIIMALMRPFINIFSTYAIIFKTFGTRCRCKPLYK
jgi:hypothetical protein